MQDTAEYPDMTLLADSRDEDRPGVVFLFSGQGCQYPGMAGGLWESWPWFRGRLEELFAVSVPSRYWPEALAAIAAGKSHSSASRTSAS